MKYKIGTHVMFYETVVVKEFITSLVEAIKNYHNPGDITVDFCLNVSQFFEKMDPARWTKKLVISQFTTACDAIKRAGAHLTLSIHDNDEVPFTMTDYRRDLNYFGCQEADMVIWGESDCLVPKNMFTYLDSVNGVAENLKIHKYIVTFAVRKMWDSSWEILEFDKFTDLEYLEKTDPGCFTSPHSIRYTMSIEEMNQLNFPVDNGEVEPNVMVINFPKFDGSLLCISSDLIKGGCNIPPGIFGLSGEDTSFMISCSRVMKNNYRQFVIKNVLKAHNREHPRKRIGALDYDGTSPSPQHNKGDWYNKCRDVNRKNLDIYTLEPQGKFLTWDDVFKG